uniref:hypothetical protein n=1 Tax=Bradyrhizobium sp. (strain ORS 278) TaxID=114615 RepID=UPI0012FF08EE|nr:hypothetical protein [Bradyrhizobium sp. ORS 278]
MTTDLTTAYLDDVVARAVSAPVLPREPWADALPNDCHTNAENFAQLSPEYAVVRGWLVNSGHWLMPHSVVRHIPSGRLIDVTPDPSNSSHPFVEHCGTERDFAILRHGRDGGWLHPPFGMEVRAK